MPEGPLATIELRTGDEAMVLELGGGEIKTKLGPATAPDAVLTGHPREILGVLTGKLSLPKARAAGMSFAGNLALLRRVRPVP